MVEQHYRWDFIGISTDSKPTPATSEKVVDGSTYYTSDNSKLYVWYKDQWYEKTATGGGGSDGIIELTADDYDYPTADPQGIALWNLDTGIYKIGGSTTLKLYYNSIQSTSGYAGGSFLILHHGTKASIYWYDSSTDAPTYILAKETFSGGAWSNFILKKNIIDNLTSPDTSAPLSANQGYVLKGLIDAIQTETFTFTLTDGTTVTKNICYKAS